MSNHQRKVHDPVIDTVQGCSDQEDELPSTPGQEHIDLATEEQDSASILGHVFNGDSIIAPSPFKKSYGDESASLVDEPLPIESAALSPFHRMALNSPLRSCSKDSPFSVNAVSVSDSLPSHVMELDSPEHDIDHDFSLENIHIDSDVPVLQNSERSSFNSNKLDELPDGLCNQPDEDIENMSCAKNFLWNQDNTGKKDTLNVDVVTSQADIFGTQLPLVTEDKIKPLQNVPTVTKQDDFSTNLSFGSSPFENISSKTPIINTSKNSMDIHSLHKNLSLRAPAGVSPSKRKRDIVDDVKIGVDTKLLKVDKPPVDGSDSDIEILSETTSTNDLSLEVVYDKHKSTQASLSTADCYDSQNLHLFVNSELSQYQSSLPSHQPLSVAKQDSILSQSPELMSMTDSVDLVCKGTISSSEESIPPADSTIKATQVESLCANRPVAFPHPNIQSLLKFPLGTSSTSSIIKPSSPVPNSTNSSLILTNTEEQMTTATNNDPKPSESASQVIEVVDTLESKNESSIETQIDFSAPQTSIIPSLVKLPHFDTPLESSSSVSPDSIFVKGQKDADKQLLDEKKSQQSLANENITKDDDIESLTEPNINSSVSNTSSIPADCAITDSSQMIISSQSTSETASLLFAKGNKSQDTLKVTYVEDSDEDNENNLRIDQSKPSIDKETNQLDNDTPNSSVIVSPCVPEKDDSSALNNSNCIHISSNASTEAITACPSFYNDQDLLNAGILKVRKHPTLPLTIWSDPITREDYYTYESHNSPNENLVVKSDTLFYDVIHPQSSIMRARVLNSLSLSDGSSDRRISDLSSISRSTSNYFADKSSSTTGSARFESTRMSIASVTAIGESFGSPPGETDMNKFVPPRPYPPIKSLKPSDSLSKVNSSDDAVSINVKEILNRKAASSSRGTSNVRRATRGRPRGRGRGKTSKNSNKFELVNEETTSTDSDLVKELPSDTFSEPSPLLSGSCTSSSEDAFSLLTESQQEAIRQASTSFSEEEEQIFLNANIVERDQISQNEIVKSKVREAMLDCNKLVFARFFDDSYYAAIITRKADHDKWQVKYLLDGIIREVREVNILPTNILPYGLVCRVRYSSSHFFNTGIVKGHCLNEEGILLHLIDINEGKLLKVTHCQILLKASVADELLERRRNFCSMTASPGASVSLDNIVQGKRRREVTPRTTPVSRLRQSPLDRKADSNLDSSEGSDGHKSLASRKKNISGISESSDYEEPSKSTKGFETPKKKIASKTPKKSKGGRTPKSKSSSTDEEGPTLNPIVELDKLPEETEPPQNTPKKRGRKPKNTPSAKKMMRLNENEMETPKKELNEIEIIKRFAGYKLLITRSDKQSSDEHSFDREHLKTLIQKGGGVLLNLFSEANVQFMSSIQNRKNTALSQRDYHSLKELAAFNSPIQVLCISDTYSLTSKYIQCLTVGIPLVSFKWVVNSSKEKKCLNWFQYLLPAGMSLLTETVHEQSYSDKFSPSTNLGQVRPLLQGYKVFLASSKTQDFCELWNTLLVTASATVFFMPHSGGNMNRILDRRTTVVIADSSIPKEQEKRANDLNIPIVSSQWFVQSLLAQCPLEYDAHPSFSHKYVKKSIISPVDATDANPSCSYSKCSSPSN